MKRIQIRMALGVCATFAALCGCGVKNDSVPGAGGIEGMPLASYESTDEAGSAMEVNAPASQEEQIGKENDMHTVDDLPRAGLHTLENFLATALLPVGHTMYVWGGGWNEEDTGAGTETRSIGVSPNWESFFDAQDASYDYKKTRYQIHDGLDCSGFVGWAVYNTMETEDGKDGYVFKSTETAEAYASYGFGDYHAAGSALEWLPGDIASMKGHVWISLGTCEDGSVLLVHASPPGVRLCGTELSGGTSDAVTLATQFMSSHYPEWFARYPKCAVSTSYLKDSGQMRWNTETFPDAEAMQALTPKALLERFEH